jgi:hypothetical protein
MSRFRLVSLACVGLLAVVLAFLYLNADRPDAQHRDASGITRTHGTMLADSDNDGGDGGDDEQGDDQDPGDQIQAPEQQEEQNEDGGGPGLMF